jgi:hypothetical protein
MSIGGIVEVYHYEDGSGKLKLNPAKKGEPTGQPFLYFDSAPEDVTALNGRLIWGGDTMVMHGQTLIARREGYTKIRFVVDSVSEVIAREEERHA